VLVAELADLGDGAVGLCALGGGEHGVGEEELRVEVPEEQALGEAERLRAGEEQLLRLLPLLFDLCGGQGHEHLAGWGGAGPPPFSPPGGWDAPPVRRAVLSGRGVVGLCTGLHMFLDAQRKPPPWPPGASGLRPGFVLAVRRWAG